ncbi:jg8381 [Pararge aegeria aegeria]|uniref:Jg8381 protein n=1 Tax=Pararge aegeria aegeria TaxID=348720 RepID=A0A8S4SG07_9NEOP|nr:jg8381 [Pararge aegeria aegeria]
MAQREAERKSNEEVDVVASGSGQNAHLEDEVQIVNSENPTSSALLRSYSAYPERNAFHTYDEPWEGVNHIVVTPDFPVPFETDTIKYFPQNIIKTERFYRTRTVKRPETPEPLGSCGCNFNCVNEIDAAAQKELFDEFWSLRDRQFQRDYLVEKVKVQEPKTSLVDDSKKRFSLNYTLVYRNKEYYVCKKFFLNTLNVTEKLIRYALLNKDRKLNMPFPEEACFNTTPRGAPFFEVTTRGNAVLVWGGYRFGKQREQGSKTRWACTKHNSSLCTAYLTTVDNQIVLYRNIHNHEKPKMEFKKCIHCSKTVLRRLTPWSPDNRLSGLQIQQASSVRTKDTLALRKSQPARMTHLQGQIYQETKKEPRFNSYKMSSFFGRLSWRPHDPAKRVQVPQAAKQRSQVQMVVRHPQRARLSTSLLHFENRRTDNEAPRLLVHQALCLLVQSEVVVRREPSQTVPRYRGYHRQHDRRPPEQTHTPTSVKRYPPNGFRFPPAFR